MANTLEALRSSVLSAENIKELSDWPDELILDYLTIIQDLIVLATQTDNNTNSLELSYYLLGTATKNRSKIKNVKSEIANLKNDCLSKANNLSKLKAKNNRISDRISELKQEFSALEGQVNKNKTENRDISKDVESLKQMLSSLSSSIPKASGILKLIRSQESIYLDTFPALAFACNFSGNGAANPTVNQSFNVSTLTRVGVGSYQLFFTNSIIRGQNVLDSFLFETRNFGTTAVDTNYQIQYVFAAGSIFLNCVQITGASAVAYDLTVSDAFSVGGLLYTGN